MEKIKKQNEKLRSKCKEFEKKTDEIDRSIQYLNSNKTMQLNSITQGNI